MNQGKQSWTPSGQLSFSFLPKIPDFRACIKVYTDGEARGHDQLLHHSFSSMEDICATSAREIRIVIDAVDKLRTTDVPQFLQRLIDLVVRGTGAQSALKVAVVSRPELEIQRQLSLPWVRKIELSSTCSQKDIESYISEAPFNLVGLCFLTTEGPRIRCCACTPALPFLALRS